MKIVDGRKKLQEEQLEARRIRDSSRKGIPFPVGIPLLGLSIVVAAYCATIISVLAPAFSLAGLGNEHGGSGGWVIVASLLILFAYFQALIVIPAGLGMLGQRWGFAMGASYILIFMFFLSPYFWYGNNLDKYVPGTGSPAANVVIGFIVLMASTLAGLRSYRRHRVRGTKPWFYIRRPAAATLPVLALCGLIAATAPFAIPYLKGNRTETVRVSQYGFSLIKPKDWYFSGPPGVVAEDSIRREAISEHKIWRSNPGRISYKIFVYDSMPFTAQSLSSFGSDQEVYSELRHIFEERKRLGGNRVALLWKGESEIAGKSCVLFSYKEMSSQENSRPLPDAEGLESQLETWIFNRPYLYSFGFDPQGSEEERTFADSLEFIPVVEEANAGGGAGGQGLQEPPYIGRRDYEWTKSLQGQGPCLGCVSVLDASHIWAIGRISASDPSVGTNIYAFNGSGWALQQRLTVDGPGPNYPASTGIKALDAAHVWAFGNGYIFFCNGSAWARQAVKESPRLEGPEDLDATAADNAWAVGGRNFAQVFHFNGIEWTPYDLGDDPRIKSGYSISEVDAVDPAHMWVIRGSSYISFFDGQSWSIQYKAEQKISNKTQDVGLTSLFAADGSHAWALSNNRVYYFDDKEWKECFHARGYNHEFRLGSAIDSGRAWVAGKDEIYLFDGQGCTKQFDVVGNIVGIKSLDASTVLVVVDDGSIYIGKKK